MTLTPSYNGQALTFVGSVPNNANPSPNASGFNMVTQSNAVEYIVVCNGVTTGYGMFVPSPSGVGAPAQIRSNAESAAGSIPMPAVEIDISPAKQGLDGLNTWFWTSGYTGGPLTVTRNALGASIQVIATPTSYLWNFGDASVCAQDPGCTGSSVLTISLGIPFPSSYESAPGVSDCDLDGQPNPTGGQPAPGAVTHC